MNKNYNIVWNTVRNMYMVTAEFVNSGGAGSQIRSQSIALGAILLIGGSVCAEEIGPQNGASIAIQDGSTITTNTSANGIDSSMAGGTGVQISGKAHIDVSGNSNSLIGIYLDNGTTNNLGSGTDIIVNNNDTVSTTTATGIKIGNKQSNSAINANQLNINVKSQKGAAYGIQDLGMGGTTDLGQNSNITVYNSGSSNAYGTYINNFSGDFKMDSGIIDVTAEEGQAIAFYSPGNASVDLGDGTTIAATSQTSSSGISIGSTNGYGSMVANALALNVVNTQSGYESGFILGTNSHANLGSDSTISVTGKGTYVEGVNVGASGVFNASSLNLSLSTENTSETTGRGIVLDGKGASADLGNGSTITLSGFDSGQAIDMKSDSGTFTADQLTINAAGQQVNGIQINGGTMDLGTGSSVSANGNAETIWATGGSFSASELTVKTQQSIGINAQGGANNVLVNIGAGSIVDGRVVGDAGSTYGLCASDSGFGNGTTTLNFNGSQDNRNTIYAEKGYGASAQFSGQTINISNTDIFMSGVGKTYGLWAIGDNSLTSAGIINGENLTITMTDTGANSAGVLVQQGGMVNLTGETSIHTDDGIAIMNASTTTNQGTTLLPGGTITGQGKMTIQGDIVNDGWGSIDLTMEAGSQFNGATSVNTDVIAMNPDAFSTLDLTLAEQSQWIINDNSNLTGLTSAGELVFTTNPENGAYSTLNAETLTLQSGSKVNVDLNAATQASTDQTPLITGGDITLAGDLHLSHSDTSDISNITTDQDLTDIPTILIDAGSAITGNFDTLSKDGAPLPDYLAVIGQVNPEDNTQYQLISGLNWYVEESSVTTSTGAHGTFTLDAGKFFEVTRTLEDVAPNTSTGWDGKTLTKKGDGKLILSGENTYSGGTHIEKGELQAISLSALGSGDIDNSGVLSLAAGGTFNLSQNITTNSGGTTRIEQGNALALNTLFQKADSQLDVSLDLSSSDPIITAQQAVIEGGTLNITGITGSLNQGVTAVTVIDAASNIDGDFDALTVAGAPASQIDFITASGRVSQADPSHYDIAAGLTWYADSYNALAPADGTFTLADATQSFTLGVEMADVAANSTSGWDGKTLTKKGDGTLIMDANNTYSGATHVQDGTLWLAQNASIGAESSQQSVDITEGATLGASDNAVINAGVENSGTVRFDDAVTINGDVTNNGAIISGSGTVPLTNNLLTDNTQPNSTLLINGDYTSHGGSLTLNTYLGDDSAPTDMLKVTGSTSGETTLYITPTGGNGAETLQGIEVIDVGGESNGVFTQGNQVQAGLYEYRLYQDSSDGDWYLRSKAGTTPPEPPVPPTPPGPPEPVPPTPEPTPQYRADIGAFLGNQWMARNLQMQTLYDREGSQYHSTDGHAWARFKAGSADSQAAHGLVEINNDYSQFQVGSDILTWDDTVQSLAIGLMGNYINANTDSTGNRGADGSRFSASGNVKGYNLGIYTTWFANTNTHQGVYIDSWYQYGIYDNSVKNGDVGSESYDANTNTASLETGYRYDIALANKNNLSFTPQAQIVWQNYRADSITDNGGTRIDGQDSDSWNMRLGLRMDATLHKGEYTIIQPFIEANWLHTNDSVAVSFDSAEVEQDIPANRAEFRLGLQAIIDRRWNITAQAGGQKGSHSFDDLNGNLNLRYNW